MKIWTRSALLLCAGLAGAAKWTPSGTDWTFTCGPVTVKVEQALGRVIEYQWRGRNLLGTDGSMFYPGPQQAFPNTWPPPAGFTLDNAVNFGFTPNADSTVLLARPTQVGSGTIYLPWRKYSYDSLSGSLVTEYGIKNTSTDSTAKVSPWEVTRVPPTSLLFFPDGGAVSVTFSMSAIVPAKLDSFVWIQGKSGNSQAKYFRDGKEGWLAQINDSILFVKSFPEIGPGSFAPNESEVELYQESGFIEMEDQGAYTTLGPGDSLSWTVRWQSKAVPRASVTAGSRALVDSARALAALKPSGTLPRTVARPAPILVGPRVDPLGRVLSPSGQALLRGRLQSAPLP
jgi:hypothetical protein